MFRELGTTLPGTPVSLSFTFSVYPVRDCRNANLLLHLLPLLSRKPMLHLPYSTLYLHVRWVPVVDNNPSVKSASVLR